MASSSHRIVFIIFSFPFRCFACADDPDGFSSFGKAYHQQSVAIRVANDDLAMFLLRMIRIRKNRSQGVSEDGCRLLERHACFLSFASALASSHSNEGVMSVSPLFPLTAETELITNPHWHAVHEDD